MKVLSRAERKKNLSKGKKIVNAVITSIIIIIFVLALAAMIYLLVQLIGGNAPSLFGYRFYFVLTESMSPYLEPKDMILSKIIEDNSDVEYVKSMVHEGDVVTYLGKIGQNDAFITHRVIKAEDKDGVIYYDEETDSYMIITKGDNNSGPDKPIPITKLNAVMVKKVDFISAIYNFSSNRAGGFILMGIPIILILIPFILRLIIVIKTPEEDKKKISGEEEKKRLEEEIARKAVEEFIAEKKKAEEKASGVSDGNKEN